MANIAPFQPSFAGGELSPYLWGRYDLDQYNQGCAELINYVALPYGPIVKRCGTRYIDDISTIASGGHRLLKFVYSIDQAMILLLTPNLMSFYFELGEVMDGDHPYTIPTPWDADDIKTLSYAQTGDIIWAVCGSKPPQKIMRYGWTDWRIEEETFINPPSEWTGTNWPRRVCFYDQRLIYASTPRERLSLWASRIGIFNDFTKETVTDDDTEVMDTDAIWYTLASDESNEISWLLPLEILAIGTAGAEFKVSPSALNETITPNNFKVSKQTSFGSKSVEAAAIGDGAIFIQRSNSRIRIYSYETLTDTWEAKNATMFCDHICKAGAVKLVVTNVKDTYCWVLLGDGSLAVFTYEKGQKIAAWHRHNINGKILDIAVIPGEGISDDSDQIWMIVEREINDKKQIYMEVLAPPFGAEPDDSLVYMDSFLEYDGTPTYMISGLEHLALQEVRVTIDGADGGYFEISKMGILTLPVLGSHVKIGLDYTARFVSLDVNSIDNNTMGRKKRLLRLDLFMLHSTGLRIGTVDESVLDFSNKTTEEIYFGPTHVMNTKPEKFSGVKEILVSSKAAKDIKVILETTYPFPSIIRDIRYYLDVN